MNIKIFIDNTFITLVHFHALNLTGKCTNTLSYCWTSSIHHNIFYRLFLFSPMWNLYQNQLKCTATVVVSFH